MAAVTINLAALAGISATPQATQLSPGFPDELNALMGAIEIPDPGGGPPTLAAEGGASNLGPNAQSNQPDFLPLSAIAQQPVNPIGVTPTSSSGNKSAKTTPPDPTLMAMAAVATVPVAQTLPTGAPQPVSTIVSFTPAVSTTSAVRTTSAEGVASSGAQATSSVSLDSVAAAAAELAPTIQFDLKTPAPAPAEAPIAIPSQVPSDGRTPVLSTGPTLSAAANQTAQPLAAPALAVASQPSSLSKAVSESTQPEPAPAAAQAVTTAEVSVSATPATRLSLPQAPVQNSAVSAVAAKGTAPAASATPVASGTSTSSEGQSQNSPGNSAGDRSPSQPTAAPDVSVTAMATQATPTGSVPQAAPNAPTALSDPQRLDIVRQVADRMELMAAARPQEGVTIHLQPHGLGDVTIVVKSVGKDIEATFSATNSTVRAALADSRDALNQAVTAKGYNLVGVNVSAHSQSTSGQGRQSPSNQQPASQAFGNPSSGGGPNGSTNSRGGASATAATTAIKTEDDAEPNPIGVEGVDYRI